MLLEKKKTIFEILSIYLRHNLFSIKHHSIYVRRLGDRGLLKTTCVLVSVRKRVLYKDIGKYTNFKAKTYGTFLYLVIVYCLKNHIYMYNFVGDLMGN